MSGRPKDPKPWAVGNHPAGPEPWAGQPLRVVNSGRYFTPRTLFTAEECNAALGELGDNMIAAIYIAGQHAAQNWQLANATAPGALALNNFATDPKYGRIALIGQNFGVSTSQVYFSSSGGNRWVAAGGAQAASGSITAQLLGLVFSTAGACAVATYPGATDLTTVTDEVVRLTIASSSSPPLAGIYFNGIYIFIGRDGSSQFIKTSIGGSWTSRTGAPAGWSNHLNFYAAANSTRVMSVATGLGIVTNDAHFITSTDGTTWSSGTFTLPSGSWVTGLDWSVDRWILAMTNGTSSTFYTSTDDGGTWVLASSPALVASGVAALGALLFSTFYDGTHARYGVWSVDGGVTWTSGTSWSGGGADRVWSTGHSFATISALTGTYGVSAPMG